MGNTGTKLIVGLGNPGDTYRMTRHNAGFLVIDDIAEKHSIPVRKWKHNADIGKGTVDNHPVILVKPMAFMNLSGLPVRRTADYFGITGKDMIIIHDDIDLTYGRIKIKEKGGHGGHKGVKSLMDAFGGGNFIRLRIGIGRSGNGSDVSEHVLGKFSRSEQESLIRIIEKTREAVEMILAKGAGMSMNLVNRREI